MSLFLFPIICRIGTTYKDIPEQYIPRTWTCWSQTCCISLWLPLRPSPPSHPWVWWAGLEASSPCSSFKLGGLWCEASSVCTGKMLFVDQAPATCLAGGLCHQEKRARSPLCVSGQNSALSGIFVFSHSKNLNVGTCFLDLLPTTAGMEMAVCWTKKH